MSSCQCFILQLISGFFVFHGGVSITYGANENGMRHEGNAQLVGSVISTPCSIVMKDRYQTVDFSSLTLTALSSKNFREQHSQPFDIELRDCGSLYSLIDSKAWSIKFDGQSATNVNAFVLHGPSQGLGVSVLDDSKQVLTPGQNYPLYDSVLRQDKLEQTLFLRYFLQLELTGEPIQAGSYQGLVRFFIDYQ